MHRVVGFKPIDEMAPIRLWGRNPCPLIRTRWRGIEIHTQGMPTHAHGMKNLFLLGGTLPKTGAVVSDVSRQNDRVKVGSETTTPLVRVRKWGGKP